MGIAESLIRYFIRHVIFGGIDILKKPQYRKSALLLIFGIIGLASISMVNLIPMSAFGGNLGIPTIIAGLSEVAVITGFSLTFGFLVTGIFLKLMPKSRYQNMLVGILFLVSVIICSAIFYGVQIFYPSLSIQAMYIIFVESMSLIGLYIWAFLMVIALLTLTRTYFTGFIGKVINFPREPDRFFFQDIIQVIVLLLGIPYLILLITGIGSWIGILNLAAFDEIGVLASFIGTNGIAYRLGLAYFIPPSILNSLVRIIIGLVGVSAWLIVLETLVRFKTRPAGDLAAEIIAYFFIFTQARIFILLQPIDPINIALDIILNMFGILYSIQAYAIRIQRSTEKQITRKDRTTVSSPQIYLLFGFGLNFVLTLLLGVLNGRFIFLLTQFNIVILIGGAIITIFISFYYSHSRSGQQALEKSISISEAFKEVIQILSPSQAQQLLSTIGQNIEQGVSKITSSASNLIQAFSQNLLKRFISDTEEDSPSNE